MESVIIDKTAYLYDLLHLNGKSLVGMKYIERLN
jgi:ATP-dependent DNA ligase